MSKDWKWNKLINVSSKQVNYILGCTIKKIKQFLEEIIGLTRTSKVLYKIKKTKINFVFIMVAPLTYFVKYNNNNDKEIKREEKQSKKVIFIYLFKVQS